MGLGLEDHRRLTFILIGMEAVLLVAVVILRGHHPPNHDELNFLETGLRMLGTKGNPKEFIHGSFLYDVMAILHGVAYLAQGLWNHNWDPDQYIEFYLANRGGYLLIGRLIVVAFAAVLLWAVHRLAEILYGSHAVGLLAVAMLALSILLPLTSLLKEDLPASAFAVLSVLVLFDPSKKLRMPVQWCLSGVLCGVATATKYSIVSLVVVPIALMLLRKPEIAWRLVVVFAVSMGLAFSAIEPYLFLDFSRAMRDVGVLGGVLTPEGAGRSMALRYVEYLPLGMGGALIISVFIVGVKVCLGTDERAKAIMAFLAVAGVLLMANAYGFLRYAMPLAPFICLVVAGELWRKGILKARSGLVVIGVAILFTWPANVIAAKYLVLLSRPDTREVSKVWIEAQVPSGSKVLLEGTITGESIFSPALLPTAEWFQVRLREAQAAGATGKFLQVAASRAAKSGRPRYNLVENYIEEVSNYKDLEYVVLARYDGPLRSESPYMDSTKDHRVREAVALRQKAVRQLKEDFTEVFSATPVPNLRFDWFTDNPDFLRLWSVPLGSYNEWLVGPRISVYRNHLAKQ